MKRKIVYTIFVILLFANQLITPTIASTSDQGLGCGGGLGPVGEALCNITSSDSPKVGGQLNKLISTVIGFMTIVAGLWFMFQFITAGYGWLSAGGDKSKTEAAWHKITNSLIGITVVVSAWVIIGLIGKIIGLDILNPGAVLQILIQ